MPAPSRRALLAALTASVLLLAGPLVRAEETFITLASTTSTENSGLFAHLLPLFEEDSGIKVRVVAVGTGQALAIARNGDADLLLVHHRPSEAAFVAEGYGTERRDVMYNDFVLIGPAADPAGVAGTGEVTAALARIAAQELPFASRGDDSGTHKKEAALWQAAGIDPGEASGGWYRETGSGMGATLNTAVAMEAYVLSDRATWIAFQNKGEHRVVLEGDPRLFNQYGVVPVSPARHPHVKAEAAQAFVDWLTSATGQAAIAAYRRDGRQLFFPNAGGSS